MLATQAIINPFGRGSGRAGKAVLTNGHCGSTRRTGSAITTGCGSGAGGGSIAGLRGSGLCSISRVAMAGTGGGAGVQVVLHRAHFTARPANFSSGTEYTASQDGQMICIV